MRSSDLHDAGDQSEAVRLAGVVGVRHAQADGKEAVPAIAVALADAGLDGGVRSMVVRASQIAGGVVLGFFRLSGLLAPEGGMGR
jgi:hypothetical protein